MLYKRAVLFGAGASFGSPSILPVSPPLGADLYKVLAKSFPNSWGAVSEELKKKFETHFEKGMGALWSMYPNAISNLKPGAPSPNILMQDLARFFISFRIAIHRQDSYSKFLIKLWSFNKGNETCFATLNYEVLLEQAMCLLGLQRRVIRPHGGCMFWPKRGGKIFVTKRAIGQGFHSISSRIRYLEINYIQKLLNKHNQAQYPCMAIYMEGKATQIAQQYLWRIQNRLQRIITDCESLSLIGVRPWPNDFHLWNSIFNTNAKIFYVGGQKDYNILLQNRVQNRQTCFISDNFESAMEDLIKFF